MKSQGKYFCPKCLSLTFSLRYMTKRKWNKPRGLPQYCKKCCIIKPRKFWIHGLRNLMKKKGGD